MVKTNKKKIRSSKNKTSHKKNRSKQLKVIKNQKGGERIDWEKYSNVESLDLMEIIPNSDNPPKKFPFHFHYFIDNEDEFRILIEKIRNNDTLLKLNIGRTFFKADQFIQLLKNLPKNIETLDLTYGGVLPPPSLWSLRMFNTDPLIDLFVNNPSNPPLPTIILGERGGVFLSKEGIYNLCKLRFFGKIKDIKINHNLNEIFIMRRLLEKMKKQALFAITTFTQGESLQLNPSKNNKALPRLPLEIQEQIMISMYPLTHEDQITNEELFKLCTFGYPKDLLVFVDHFVREFQPDFKLVESYSEIATDSFKYFYPKENYYMIHTRFLKRKNTDDIYFNKEWMVALLNRKNYRQFKEFLEYLSPNQKFQPYQTKQTNESEPRKKQFYGYNNLNLNT